MNVNLWPDEKSTGSFVFPLPPAQTDHRFMVQENKFHCSGVLLGMKVEVSLPFKRDINRAETGISKATQ